MSYILEALRKADSERERGAVPDIHTQPLFATDRDDTPARPRWVVPVLAASVVLLVGALAFVLLRGRDDTAVAARAPQSAPGSPTTTPGVTASTPAAQAPGSQPAAPAIAPVTPPSATPSASPAPSGPPATAQAPRKAIAEATPREPAHKPAPPTPAATPRSDTRAPAATAASPGAAPAAAGTAAASSTGGERVYAVNELPDDVRRAVPNFTFGGAVYSDNAASRMLIINGQLFNEGGQPSAGVVLDQIRLKSAVFRYRGYRYEMPY